MSYYKRHQNLIKKFKIDLIKEIPSIRIFDNHVGLFYTKNNTPIKIGINGQADCFALFPSIHGLLYISLEFKTGNARQSKDQKNWQKFIEKNNGIYMIIRDDYYSQIEDLKKRLNWQDS